MKNLLLTLSVFLVLGLTNTFAQTSSNETAPVMTFEKTVHDYGTINKGADAAYEFVFTNTGKEPLILSRPRSNCGCTVPQWPQQPIMPGQSDKIKVTYDSNRLGAINKQVTVMSNATNSPIVLQIKGSVVE
jgi:hypothetical protein